MPARAPHDAPPPADHPRGEPDAPSAAALQAEAHIMAQFSDLFRVEQAKEREYPYTAHYMDDQGVRRETEVTRASQFLALDELDAHQTVSSHRFGFVFVYDSTDHYIRHSAEVLMEWIVARTALANIPSVCGSNTMTSCIDEAHDVVCVSVRAYLVE